MFISPPFLLPAPFVLRILGFQLCCRKSGVPREIYKISGKGAKRQKIGPTPPRSSQGLKDFTQQIPICRRFGVSELRSGRSVLCSCFSITRLPNYSITKSD